MVRLVRSGRWLKICGVAVIAALAFAALCPANWLPRTGHWEIEHFLAFFVATSIVCFAWPRPYLVGGTLMTVGALLEALQLLTPDRTANFWGAFFSAAGAFVAALLAELFIRASRWRVRQPRANSKSDTARLAGQTNPSKSSNS